MKVSTLLASLALIGATSVSASTLLESWEYSSDTDLETYWPACTWYNSSYITSITTSSTYYTLGSYSLAITDSGAWAWAVIDSTGSSTCTSFLSTIGSFDGSSVVISVDVYASSTAASYTGLVLGLNGEDLGSSADLYQTDAVYVSANTWTTVTFTLTSAEVALIADSSYLQVLFALSCDGETTYYLDNLTVTAVPEPASVALLGGIGALGFVMIRRRKTA